MAIPTSYLDPGAYQQEVLVPGGSSFSTLPLTVGLIGIGSDVKSATNEAVVRGQITGETVNFAGTPTVDTLANRAFRRQAATTLYKNGVAMLNTDWLFQNAAITSDGATAVDCTIGSNLGTLTLGVDGRTPIAIEFSAAPATATLVLASATSGSVSVTINSVTSTTAWASDNNTTATNAAANITSTFSNVVVSAVATSGSIVITAKGGIDGGVLSISATTAVGTWALNGGAAAATVSGLFTPVVSMKAATTTNRIVVSHGATAAATTLTELAAGINAAFAFATAANLGSVAASVAYGPNYSAIATVVSTKLVITSPTATNSALSDVAIFPSYPAAADLTAVQVAFTGSTAVAVPADGARGHAKTILQLVPTLVGAAVYTIDYVSLSQLTDALASAGSLAPMSSITKVGDFQSVTTYSSASDYAASGNLVTWATGNYTTAAITGNVGTFDLTIDNTLSLSVDGKANVDINLTTLASPPPGYVSPTANAVTVAQAVLNINAVLNASSAYGIRYSAVASNVGGKLTLTSPTIGQAGIVEINRAPVGSPTLYAGNTLFSVLQSATPYSVRGVGYHPSPAGTYYISYYYTRPIADYANPKQYFRLDDVYADIGPQSPTNTLSVAARLAFQNGAPSVFVVQVDDRANPGVATQQAYEAALTAAGAVDGITEIVVLDTRAALMVDTFQFVTTQNSVNVAKPCRAWYGMPKGTAIGDRDTAGTFVYTAANILFTPPDSPSRGRHFLVAPDQANTTITLPDGSSQTFAVDGSFLAAALAGSYTGRSSVSDAMVNSALLGFDATASTTNTFPTYLRPQRALLASQGVWVLTNKGGKIVSMDPVSTERANGKMAEFEEPSVSSEKDAIVQSINQSVSANLVGLVPSDLQGFILTVKSVIGTQIQASIDRGVVGPYRDANGRARALSYATDIQVFQSAADPRTFLFNYYFYGRYPAKYFFGSYSVDSPFFSSSNTGLTA